MWQFCEHDECDYCFFAKLNKDEVPDALEGKQTYFSEYMTIQDTDVLWLDVKSGLRFQSERHIPVLAGRMSSGEAQYIAAVPEEPERALAGWSQYRLCTVSVGQSEVEFFSNEEAYGPQHSTSFAVLVLRFDPAVYPELVDDLEDSGIAEGCDSTGPLRWKPVIDQCAKCV